RSFFLQVPVVEDVAHQIDVGGWQSVLEKVAGVETQTIAKRKGIHVFFENGANNGQIKDATLQMGMSKDKLHPEPALCAADIDKGFVIAPGTFCGDRFCGAQA